MAGWLNVVCALVSLNAPTVNDQSRPRHRLGHAAPPSKNRAQSVAGLFIISHVLSSPTTSTQSAKIANRARFGSIMAITSTPAPQPQGNLHTRGISSNPRSGSTQTQAPSRYTLELQPWTQYLSVTLTQCSPTHTLLGTPSQRLVRQWGLNHQELEGFESCWRWGTWRLNLASAVSSTPVSMDRLDTNHHRPHFHELFESVRRSTGEWFDSKLCFNVSMFNHTLVFRFSSHLKTMDFSATQQAAFEEEYVDFIAGQDHTFTSMVVDTQEAHRKLLRAEAQTMHRGCEVQYSRSLLRLRSNGSLVPHEKMSRFNSITASMRSAETTPEEFLNLVAEI